MGEFFVILFFVLCVVTVVGHGIWVLMAAILRRMGGARVPGEYITQVTRDRLADVQASCRQLDHLVRDGRIDQTTYNFLREALDRDFQGLQNDAVVRLDRMVLGREIDREQGNAWRRELVREFQEGSMPPRVGAGQNDAVAAPESPISEKPPVPAPFVPRKETGLKDRLGTASGESDKKTAEDTSDFVEAEVVGPVAADRVVEKPAAHPLDRQEMPVAAVTPRRSLAEILSTFMLEKNIRWGELLSGMLIVGSVIGLVLSLREQLENTIPYFANLLFMLATAAVHAAGIYTLRQWNLKATSRGVLTIGLLLVPLNFLAACLLAERRAVTDPWFLSAMLVGLAGFSAMTYFSCRSLFAAQWWMPAIGILAGCLAQPLINRMAAAAGTLQLHLLALVSVLGVVVGNGALCRRVMKNPGPPDDDSECQLRTLGFSAFSFATAMGLLIARSDAVCSSLDQVSIVATLFAAMVLAAGLVVQRRHVEEPSSPFHITGISLSVAGVLLGAMAFVPAWPRPELVILVAFFNVMVLTAAAFRAGRAACLMVAVANLAILTTLLTHFFSGSFSDGRDLANQTLEWMMSPTTSLALTIATLLATGLAMGVPRATRHKVFALRQLLFEAGGCLAAVSIFVALLGGFVNSSGERTSDLRIASGVLGFHALAALLAGAISARRSLLRVGAGLLLVALVHLLICSSELRSALSIDNHTAALLLGLLVHGVICAMAGLSGHVFFRGADSASERRGIIAKDLSAAGLITSLAGMGVALFLHHADFGRLAIEMLLVCGIWCVGTVIHRHRGVFDAFQALTFASAVSVAAWFAGAYFECRAWRSVDFWKTQFAFASALALVWSLLRLWWRGTETFSGLLRPKGITVDAVASCALVAAVLAGATLSVLPGIRLEMEDAVGVVSWAASATQLPFEEYVGSMHRWGDSLWLPLGLLAAAVLVQHAGRYALRHLHCLLLLGGAVSILLVVGQDADRATASALRWSLSVYGLLVAFLLGRGKLLGRAWEKIRPNPAGLDDATAFVGPSLAHTALVLTIVPILMLITCAAARGVGGHAFGGPLPGSVFHTNVMLVEVNYGIPLALIVTALLSHAIGRRESRYALCGSVIMMYLVATGLVLFAINSNPELMERLVDIFQYAVIFAAAYGMVWIALHKQIRGSHATPPHEDGQLLSHIIIPGLMVTFLSLVAMITVVWQSGTPDSLSVRIGSWKGYLALIATCALYVWFFRRHLWQHVSWFSLGTFVALLGTIAATVHGNVPWEWIALRLLMLGWVATAALTSLLPWWLTRFDRGDHEKRQRQKVSSGAFTLSAAAVAFFLACRSIAGDPDKVWVFVAMGGLLLLASVLVYRFGAALAYAGQLLIVAASVFLLQTDWLKSGHEVIHIALAASALYALFWTVVEVARQRGFGRSPPGRWPLYHRSATIGLLCVTALLIELEFVAQFFAGARYPPGEGFVMENFSGWIATACVGTLSTALVWDRESRVRLFPLFLWGLVCVTLPVVWAFGGKGLWAYNSLAVVSYLAICGWLWRNQFALVRWGTRVGVDDMAEVAQSSARWFIGCQAILCVLLTAAQLLSLWQFDGRELRFAAALVPFAGAFSLAAVATYPGRQGLRTLAVTLFSVFGIFCSWAQIPGGFQGGLWLERFVHLMAVSAFLTFLYSTLLPRFFHVTAAWSGPLRRGTQMVTGLALSSLLVILALEMSLFDPGEGVQGMNPVHAVAVAVALIAMVAGLISAALRSERDPFSLSPQGRQAYVYVAQLITAFLVLHVRMTWPELFPMAFAEKYWYYLLVALAFLGTGVGEIFQRKKVAVLADPFAHTGLVISLAPVVFSFLVARGDRPGIFLTVGLLHLLVSLIRRSMLIGCSAIFFGNLALWSFYANFENWSLLDRPQFWLIPPAVSVLVAIHLTRERLTGDVVSVGLYLSIGVIYFSSTSEIFISGIGEHILPPVILATLAVIGVFSGIGLQIRAYLYLGASFLFVALLSMVMHAHQRFDHVWPWWAFGISLGTTILVVFGMFEKKRPELTAWIEKIRRWDG